MKMFYTIPIFTMFINGFVADITNTTDVIQNITSITNTTDSPYSYNVSTIYPTSIISTKKNYTSTSYTNDVNDKIYGSNMVLPIIGSCMLYTLSQL